MFSMAWNIRWPASFRCDSVWRENPRPMATRSCAWTGKTPFIPGKVTIIEEAGQAVVDSGMDPADALAEANTRADEALAQYNESVVGQ